MIDAHRSLMKKLIHRVEAIASAVAFLTHPESGFINGENLTVDGGWNT